MSSTEAFSVRCDHCQTTFAAGTKRCVHCGGPLAGGLLAALRAAGDHEPLPGALETDAEEEASTRRGNKMWVVWAFLAIGISMLRQCA